MTIEVAAPVRAALARGQGVVALESTLICHGMPRPLNRELALEIEAVVRAEGAMPATIAVLDGRVLVGLDEASLTRLAAADEVEKCTTRDLPRVVASGALGATTVAATVFVAARVGIRLMATGGLGGVHHGGETSLDISADLDELARSRALVVCSGIKSILDRPRTLERLETLGVPLVGYGCAELPGFHSIGTGLAVARVDGVEATAALWRAHGALGLPGGMVLAQPPPAADALAAVDVERWVAESHAAAARQGIHGSAETPFVLAEMAARSRGATVRVNRTLVLANARLAARLACAVATSPTAADGQMEA
jgi:pseudouridine-5'-phosphate glycosidase